MDVNASVGAEPNSTTSETVSIHFKLEHVERYSAAGEFTCSPLVKAGGGYVCLKVYPCGTEFAKLPKGKVRPPAAYVEYVPNVIWSDKWRLPDISYSITVVNVREELNLTRKNQFTFTARDTARGWRNMLEAAEDWGKYRQMGWLTDDGAMIFKASISGNLRTEQSLAEGLAGTTKMWSSGKLSDMTLLSDHGDEFSCHRCVLVNASPVFEQMLTSDWQEGKEARVTIRGESTSVVQIFITYIYTNLLPKYADYVALLRLADMYELTELSKVCLSKMAESATAATVGETLRTFARHKRCKGADDACQEIVKRAKSNDNIAVAIARDFVFEKASMTIQKKFVQNLFDNKIVVVKAVTPILDDDLLAD